MFASAQIEQPYFVPENKTQFELDERIDGKSTETELLAILLMRTCSCVAKLWFITVQPKYKSDGKLQLN